MSIDFKDRRVVSFQSRQSAEIAKLIVAAGGKPVIAPSLREIPLERNVEAFSFAELLFAGQISAVILVTGRLPQSIPLSNLLKHLSRYTSLRLDPSLSLHCGSWG